MENKKDSCSVSYAKRNDKDCRHKFVKVYGNKKICVRCGFVKWW